MVAEDARALVLKAFHAARESGKADWRRMSVAVLKNRLLDLTGKQFREQEYGAERFLEFVAGLSDILSLDLGSKPAVVELIADSGESTTMPNETDKRPIPERRRIRADLWNAVVDYASGKGYVWDNLRQTVRVVEDAAADPMVLPTINRDQMAKWRREFVQEHSRGTSAAAELPLNMWETNLLGTVALPRDLRAPWNHFCKEKVLQLLKEWFEERGVALPLDLEVDPAAVKESESDSLREFVFDCIRVMTPSELAQIRLPASVLNRIPRRGRWRK